MSLDRYDHVQKIIEKGIDELFDQVFENYYFNLSDEELNYLLILSCEKNELYMAKIIYNKVSELDIIKRKYIIFISVHKVITNTTLEICLLQSIDNNNIEMYKWLKEIGVFLPQDKILLYWKTGCKSGNLEIVNDIFKDCYEESEKLLEYGLKICLEKGDFLLFKYIENLGEFQKGSWIFNHYLLNSVSNVEFFYHLYYNYSNYINFEIVCDFLNQNKLDEIKIILSYQFFSPNTIINLVYYYLEKNKIININIIKYLSDRIDDFSIKIKLLVECILHKSLYLDDLKDLIEYTNFNIIMISKVFDLVYNEYKKESDSELKSCFKFFLQYLIEKGYEPTKNNEFYSFYYTKKEEIMLQKI